MLRRLAPHWLKERDLRSVVLGFEEAGRAHGGSGALYVQDSETPGSGVSARASLTLLPRDARRPKNSY